MEIRFWSPESEFLGLIPGVTIIFPFVHFKERSRLTSNGEAISPSAPAFIAFDALSSTKSSTVPFLQGTCLDPLCFDWLGM